MYNKFFLIFFLVVLMGCFGEKSEDVKFFKKRNTEKAFLLINADSTDKLGAPSLVESVFGGFIIYDYAFHKFIKFDKQGNRLFSFGRKGKGPGEFQEVFGFWSFDDFYFVFDYTNAKLIKYTSGGKFIKDISLNLDNFPKFPTRMEILGPNKFIIPSLGKNGSLLMSVDATKNKITYFGNAVGDYTERLDHQEISQAISSKRIPTYMLNWVQLSSNRTGIFSFQQTTALLEKYSPLTEVIWKRKVKIPPMNNLFEVYFKKNIERMNKGLPFKYSFVYAKDMEANEKGVAILLNLLKDQPVTVIWVSNDGKSGAIVTFRGMKRHPDQFSISEDKSYIFFTNSLQGKVYRAKWPL